MEKHETKKILVVIFLRQIIYFCLFWSFYAIGWHYFVTIKSGHDYILYDASILVPIASIFFYITTALFFALKTPTSRSPEPSDKQPQSQT